MKVVNLAAHRNRDLVAVLAELMQLAQTGRCTGLAFIAKIGRDHAPGMTGDYRSNAEEALPAAAKLYHKILSNQSDEAQERGSGT